MSITLNTATPRAKITRAVSSVLPKGQTFIVRIQKSVLGGMEVVRVVTSAWKSLRPIERISRVRKAVDRMLSEQEQEKILWLSVLTPEEYKASVGKSRSSTGMKSPAKSKAARRSPVESAARTRRNAAGGAGKPL